MEAFYEFIGGYILGISIVSVFACVFDKRRAIKHKRRVRESTLLLLSALGGSAAMYLTMLIIRHKTLHKKFMLGIPFIMLLQASAAFIIWKYLL